MNGLAEVIPISSRRAQKQRAGHPSTVRPVAPQQRNRRLIIFCAGLLGLIGALMVIDRVVIPHPPASLSAPLAPEVRQGLYQRTLADVLAACALPAAQGGILRQHCVQQTRFLQDLPECTGECSRLTRAVLGRGR